MSQTPTFSEMLRAAIDARLADLHVSIPGRVESYDAGKLSVDVQPLIRHSYIDEDGDRQIESYPVIPAVPVVFPGSGSYRITFPISKGDLVLLVFSEASLDKWLETETVVDPIDDRRNQMIDAVAFPGLRSFKNPNAASESALVIDVPTEILLGSDSASDPVALKSDIDAIESAISGAATGVNDGGALFKTNILAAWPSPVGATKVKAE